MTPTPHLRIAERPAPRPDLAEQLAAPIAAATERPPAVGQAGPLQMTPLLTARLSAWRELSSRWMILLLLPALIPVGLLLPEATATAWSLFLATLIAPVICVMAAAGGRAESDAFWRGLGGPAWARLLGRQLVHLVFVGGAIATILLSLMGWDALRKGVSPSEAEVLLFGLLLAYPALYTATAAARARLDGLRVIVGPLAALVVIGVGMYASVTWIRDWSEPIGLIIRTGGFTLAALLAAYRWEQTAGVWGSAVQRRGRHLPDLAIIGLIALSVGGEWAWSGGVLPPGYTGTDIATDGSIAVFSTSDYRITDGPHRVWAYSESRGYRRLPGLHDHAMVGPGEALLAYTDDTLTLMQDGAVLSCDRPVEKLRGWNVGWSSTGRSVLIRQTGDPHGLSSFGMDLDTGHCGVLAPSLWLDDQRVSIQGAEVRWGEQSATLDLSTAPTVRDWDGPTSRRAILKDDTGHYYTIALLGDQLAVDGPISGFVMDGEPVRPFLGSWYPLGDLRFDHETARVTDITDGTTWDLSDRDSVWPRYGRRGSDLLVLEGRDLSTIKPAQR